MKALRWRGLLGLLLGGALLASCTLQIAWEDIPPTVAVVPRTPSPLATRLPTPCAGARIAGKGCEAWAKVYLRSCCPPWEASTTSDGEGSFAFEALTVGTYTVTMGQYSEVVTLGTCYSQVNVDLCPPAIQPLLAFP